MFAANRALSFDRLRCIGRVQGYHTERKAQSVIAKRPTRQRLLINEVKGELHKVLNDEQMVNYTCYS